MVEECKEIYKKCLGILNEYWKHFSEIENVLNIQVANKYVNGKDTGEPSIVFYVQKKEKDEKKLKANQIIPKEILGCKTDVIELSTPDFVLGKTTVSKLDPEEQAIIASGLKRRNCK
jgi:hypothetical protein